jgi:hypothetical protein
MFLVKYSVEGFPGEHTAGPYAESEAQYHRDDIAGFEGVKYAIIVPVPQETLDKLQLAFK